jgi:hypothetical protein
LSDRQAGNAVFTSLGRTLLSAASRAVMNKADAHGGPEGAASNSFVRVIPHYHRTIPLPHAPCEAQLLFGVGSITKTNSGMIDLVLLSTLCFSAKAENLKDRISVVRVRT